MIVEGGVGKISIEWVAWCEKVKRLHEMSAGDGDGLSTRLSIAATLYVLITRRVVNRVSLVELITSKLKTLSCEPLSLRPPTVLDCAYASQAAFAAPRLGSS
jgi:hypothetical protein